MIAVIFTSQRTEYTDGYQKYNEQLEAIAASLPGFIQQDSSRDANGYGISISYWKDEESAKAFKQVPVHFAAQQKGKTHYYEWYDVKVCQVNRHYGTKKQS